VNAQRDAGPERPHAQFGIDVDAMPDGTVVVPHGELDALSAPVFAAVLDAVCARDIHLVVIDLSDVRACNVAALRAMTELAARLHTVDGRVRIVARTVLDRMLALTDLHSMFELDDAGNAGTGNALSSEPHRRADVYRSLRPRMTSPHRLATDG
jgi:anti-anti-sigma factor